MDLITQRINLFYAFSKYEWWANTSYFIAAPFRLSQAPFEIS